MLDRQVDRLGRRAFILMALAAVVLPTAACSQARKNENGQGIAPEIEPRVAMTVYRDPNCQCCEQWAALAEVAGFAVTMIDDPDMAARKEALGVPETLASCHTATAGGLAFEGHVPLDDVKRLLASNPVGLAGLAVPGMPRGAPGMEMPDGAKDPFEVVGFDRKGNSMIFSRG
jgi:hypothetical protein